MLQDDFILAVAKLCKKASERGWAPVHSIIGDGILIVQDTQSEYDVYFDTDKWEYVMPQIWEGFDNNEGVGVLPGTGRHPAVRNFQDAVQFAGQQLRSKS